jgi:hypothetical protein
MKKLIFACVALLGVATGCSNYLTMCTDELGFSVSPADTVVTAGSSFRPTVDLFSCGGRKHFGDDYAWSSSNVGVVSVDASGKVTAKSPGEATVTVTGAKYHFPGNIHVVVH